MTGPNSHPNPNRNQPPQVDPLINPERFDQDPEHYDAMLRVATAVRTGATDQLRQDAFDGLETFDALNDVAYDASLNDGVEPAELTTIRDILDVPMNHVSVPADEKPDTVVDHGEYLKQGVTRDPKTGLLDPKTHEPNAETGLRTPSKGDRDPGVRAKIDKHLQQIEAQATYLSTVHFLRGDIRDRAEAASRRLLNEALAGLNGVIDNNRDYGYVVEDFLEQRLKIVNKARNSRAEIEGKLTRTEQLYSDAQARVGVEDARAIVADGEIKKLEADAKNAATTLARAEAAISPKSRKIPAEVMDGRRRLGQLRAEIKRRTLLQKIDVSLAGHERGFYAHYRQQLVGGQAAATVNINKDATLRGLVLDALNDGDLIVNYSLSKEELQDHAQYEQEEREVIAVALEGLELDPGIENAHHVFALMVNLEDVINDYSSRVGSVSADVHDPRRAQLREHRDRLLTVYRQARYKEADFRLREMQQNPDYGFGRHPVARLSDGRIAFYDGSSMALDEEGNISPFNTSAAAYVGGAALGGTVTIP